MLLSMSVMLSGFTPETIESYIAKYGEPGAEDVGDAMMLTWQDGWVRRWLRIGPYRNVVEEGAIYAKDGHLPLELYPQAEWVKTAKPDKIEHGVMGGYGPRREGGQEIERRWYSNGAVVERSWSQWRNVGDWRSVTIIYPAALATPQPKPTATPVPEPELPAVGVR